MKKYINFILIIKLNLEFQFHDHLASLWMGSFQSVCEKEVKIMIKEVEVLKLYLKNSCKSIVKR